MRWGYAVRVFGVMLLMAASLLFQATVAGEPLPEAESGRLSGARELVGLNGLFPGEFIRDQYIITLDPDITRRFGVPILDDAIGIVLAGIGARDVLHTYRHALTGMSLRLTPLQASLLERFPGVLGVEQDQVIQIAAPGNATWGLDRLDQRALPLDGVYGPPDQGGAGVHVYILDTGLRNTHGEFTGRVLPGRNFSRNSSIFYFWDNAIDPANTSDCNGHGTHVAGTAVGQVYGVARSARVVPVRVMNCSGTGSLSAVIAGLDWVTEHHRKPAVANLSLGGGGSQAMDDAVRNAVARGVTVVAAAGNSNQDACGGSPSRVPEVISVGASTRTDARAGFSNFGRCVDIFAPGEEITAAWHQGNQELRTISGTSMAAPHVAGVAALYLGRESSATPAEVLGALRSEATTGALRGIGSGSPNLLAYVAPGAGSEPGSGDRVPVAAFTFNCEDTRCVFDGSGSTDDVAVASWDWQFGDGQRANGEVVSHNYDQAGEYRVTLTVSDTSNQTARRSHDVVIEDSSAPVCPDCSRYTGELRSGQETTIQIRDFLRSSGTIIGYLTGPPGTDFDLYLEQRRCVWGIFCSWATQATGVGTASEKGLEARVGSGNYRWRVRASQGGGGFELLSNP